MAKSSANFQALRKKLLSLKASVDVLDKRKASAKFKIKFDIDTRAIERLLDQAEKFPQEARLAFDDSLKIIANDLHATLDEAMEASVWQWSYPPTRDIVDTGQLRDSGKVFVDGDDIVISYGTEYAAIVHFSGYMKDGGETGADIYYPARPWITATLEGGGPVPKFDFAKELEANFYPFLLKRLDVFK